MQSLYSLLVFAKGDFLLYMPGFAFGKFSYYAKDAEFFAKFRKGIVVFLRNFASFLCGPLTPLIFDCEITNIEAEGEMKISLPSFWDSL